MMEFTLNIDAAGRIPIGQGNILGQLNWEHFLNRIAPDERRGKVIVNPDRGFNITSAINNIVIYPTAPTAPEHLPDKVRSRYQEDLLQSRGSPRMTMIACRATLEAACSVLIPDVKGSLMKRIDALGEKVYSQILP